MNLRSFFAVLFFGLCCLLTNTNSRYRIMGGRNRNIHDSPYVVSINNTGGYVCVGSLITFWHVVTAAHCVINFREESITVAAGVSDLRDLRANGQVRNAKLVYYPCGFRFESLDMDIAVIKMRVPFFERDTIKTIQLCHTTLYPRTPMRVSGWGWTTPYNGTFSSILQSAVLFIFAKDECAARYAMEGIVLTESMICAAVQGADTSVGDSGGPGVVNGQLCAVVSAGLTPYSSFYPTLYTNINNENVRAFINYAVQN